MKRITILLLSIVFVTAAFAQQLRNPVKKAKWGRESGAMSVIDRDLDGTRIYGDTIWSNSLDTANASDWEIWNDSDDDQNWVITADPDPPLYRIGRIQSSTWESGYALLNSDAIGAVGDPLQLASIGIKDPIDLTGHDNVAIRFQQSYMRWEDTVYVGISLDDGATWTDFVVNDLEVKVQTYEDIVLNISSVAANQPQVWFRFFFKGDWDYGWMIDDVAIIEGAYDELRINQVFARCVFDDSTNMGIYTYIPSNQVIDGIDQSQMYYDTLGVAIYGDGLNTQHNISFSTDVVPEGGSSIFDQTSDVKDSLVPFTKDTMYMAVTPGDLYLPADIGIYNFDYLLSQDETDEAPATNEDTYTLIVNDSVFARDRELTGSSGPDHYTTGGPGDGVGVVFWIPNADTVSSLDMWIHDDTDAGTTIIGKLYYWDYVNQVTVLQIETDEYVVSEDDIREWVKIPFLSYGDDEEIITGGYQYIAMAHMYYADGTTRLHLGGDGSAIHYFNNSATAFLEGVNEYDSYTEVIPFIRLNMYRTPSSVDEISAETLNVNQNFPNPFSRSTDISYSLSEPANVSLEVYDITGKKVMEINEGLKTQGSHKITISGENLESGAYYYTVHADEYQATKKMVVIK